jgi:hypothetical protein
MNNNNLINNNILNNNLKNNHLFNSGNNLINNNSMNNQIYINSTSSPISNSLHNNLMKSDALGNFDEKNDGEGNLIDNFFENDSIITDEDNAILDLPFLYKENEDESE